MRRAAVVLFVAVGALASLGAGAAAAHPVRIDATALSTTAFRLDSTGGVEVGVFDSTTIQALELAEGEYRLLPGSGLSVRCVPRVTALGAWDYDTSCDGYVSGRGSDTLIVRGYDVTLDATPLSTPIIFANAFGLAAGSTPFTGPRTFTLPPTSGDYHVQSGSGQVSSCAFGIGVDGKITYPDALEGCLEGRGTTTVRFNGVPINIDARALSTQSFLVAATFRLAAEFQPSGTVQSFRLLPLARGSYLFQTGAVSPLFWSVDLAGHIDYAAADDGWVGGRGTSTLVARGYPIEVDATALGPGDFSIAPAFGLPTQDRGVMQSLRLVPVGYRFGAGTPVSFDWRILRSSGTIDYDDSAGSCVFGRGTTRLTVGCRRLMIADVTVVEGDAGTTDATFVVALSGPTPVDVSAAYATAHGTAEAGDYVSRAGTVTIPAGQTSATIIVPVSGDTADEPDETFTISLSNTRNAVLDDDQAIGTILDDDEAPAPLDCSAVAASPHLLWPPNHKMQRVTLTGLGAGVALTITGVTQDEPLNGLGDGDTGPDAAAGPTPGSVDVRAERSGTGDGRVYRIAFTADDHQGRTCHGTTTVAVPHDAGRRPTATDSGQSVDSFGS